MVEGSRTYTRLTGEAARQRIASAARRKRGAQPGRTHGVGGAQVGGSVMRARSGRARHCERCMHKQAQQHRGRNAWTGTSTTTTHHSPLWKRKPTQLLTRRWSRLAHRVQPQEQGRASRVDWLASTTMRETLGNIPCITIVNTAVALHAALRLCQHLVDEPVVDGVLRGEIEGTVDVLL